MDRRSSRLRRPLVLLVILAGLLLLSGLVFVAIRPGEPQPDLALPDLDELVPDEPTTAGASPSAVTLLAVGDIGSCDAEADEAVAELAARLPGEIALLGDIAYQSGSPEQFARCFDPAWGDLKGRLHPVPGNHDYATEGASGYFGYFGDSAGRPGEGWYAWEHGSWQMLALNSVCAAVGGCGADSPQVAWIESQLEAADPECTIAYFHHPRHSSGRHGDAAFMEPMWQALVDGGVDVTLAGHDHSYERLMADGVRAFIVGTGGRSLYAFERTPSAFTEARTDAAYGLLELTLREGSYDWRFVALGSSGFTDAGSGECR